MSIWANIAKKAATAGKKALVTYKAGQAVQKAQAAKPKAAARPATAKPTPPTPPPTNTYNILGMQVPKTAAHVGGLILLSGAAYGIAKSSRR